MIVKASSFKIWESLWWALLGFYFPIQQYSVGRKSEGKDLTLLQLSLLVTTAQLLDRHCRSQIMPTLKLLPELEDETSLIKAAFILRSLTAFFLPQVWFWFVVMMGFFCLLGVFLTLVVSSQVLVKILFSSIMCMSTEEIDSRKIALRWSGPSKFQSSALNSILSVTNAVWALIKGCSGYRFSVVIHSYI